MTRYFSIQEAADFLKVDYKVVYRLVKEGRIPSTRIGWQFRMSEADLNAYLNAQSVKQAAVAQAMRAEGSPAAGTVAQPDQRADGTPSAQLPAGTVAMETMETGINKVRARQMEVSFINRFREKVASVETLRHPVTMQILHVDDWAPLGDESDERETLMQLLNTAFLDRRTLATMPRNAAVRFTLKGNIPLVLEAKVLAHLDAYCTAGADDAPASLADLMIEIDSLEERNRKGRAAFIVGLASPTGWEDEAISFIKGSDRGNVYRNQAVKIVLVDLRSEAIYYDQHDEMLAGFAALFELATDAENVAALQAQLKAEVDGSLSRGVILAELADSLAASTDLILEAAQALEAAGGYRIISDPDRGAILVQT